MCLAGALSHVGRPPHLDPSSAGRIHLDSARGIRHGGTVRRRPLPCQRGRMFAADRLTEFLRAVADEPEADGP